jgi:hypothetical protein
MFSNCKSIFLMMIESMKYENGDISPKLFRYMECTGTHLDAFLMIQRRHLTKPQENKMKMKNIEN